MNWTTQIKLDEATKKLGIEVVVAGDGVYLRKGSNVRLRQLQTDLEKEGIELTRYQLGSPFVEGYGRPMPMGEEPKQVVKRGKPEAKQVEKKVKESNQTAFSDGKETIRKKKVQYAGPGLFDE